MPGYEEEKKLNALSQSEWDALRSETLAYAEGLRKSGHLIVTHALQSVQTATTVRVRSGKQSVTDWTTKTKEWMEPNKPPIESTGSAEMKMLLDGRFLQQEFTGDMMGQPYSGVGITAYDNLRRRYVSTWIDTMSTGIFMMEGTGSADGKTITLKGQHPEPGGGYMTHRAVWKIVDSNTQTFDMYGTHHGGKEMKVMEITYTRRQ